MIFHLLLGIMAFIGIGIFCKKMQQMILAICPISNESLLALSALDQRDIAFVSEELEMNGVHCDSAEVFVSKESQRVWTTLLSGSGGVQFIDVPGLAHGLIGGETQRKTLIKCPVCFELCPTQHLDVGFTCVSCNCNWVWEYRGKFQLLIRY